jgi:uncharacterized Zn-finger protein
VSQEHVNEHSGERPFACDVEGCAAAFPTRSKLHKHRQLHNLHMAVCDR